MTARPQNTAALHHQPTRPAHFGKRWPGAAMAFCGTFLFTLIAADVHFHGRLAQYDGFIARQLFQHMSGWPIMFFAAISGLGELTLIAPATGVIAIWLIRQRNWRALCGWLTALLGSAILCSTLKNLFAIPRPRGFTTFTFDEDSGFSFPSGHTMSVAIFAGALVLAIMHVRSFPTTRRAGLWLAAMGLAVLEAMALLLIGVHYLTDVLGGLAISLAWLGVIRMILPPRLGTASEEIQSEVNSSTDTGTL